MVWRDARNCFEFFERFKAEVTAAQAEVFSGYCSDSKIARGPKALKFLEKRRSRVY